jgi:hypothetical protein
MVTRELRRRCLQLVRCIRCPSVAAAFAAVATAIAAAIIIATVAVAVAINACR